jgi:fructose-1,6-bisphosphatase I
MQRLISVLKQDNVDLELIMLIRSILAASKEIAFRVSQGALGDVLGSTLMQNVQGETQKQLDVISNDLLKDLLLSDDSVRAIASEEEDDVVAGNPNGRFNVAFDPLDGSSNIDINGQIGTIFTIYVTLPEFPADSPEQFLQKGREQLVAGYVLYGPSTMLVMSTGGPTRGYTLDLTHGGYLLTTPTMSIPTHSNEFAINMANYQFWASDIQAYFKEQFLVQTKDAAGTMRWNAAMVGDVHRVLTRGGVFYYPQDVRPGHENGKIRLLYEANPMAMLVENANGRAVVNQESVLDLTPTELHQRVPILLGSTDLVTAVCAAQQ